MPIAIERDARIPETVETILRELPEWFGIEEALGYEPLEEFDADTLWPGNPSLQLVKHLSG